jgi:hypothetical protein
MRAFQDICGIWENQGEIDPSTITIAQSGISSLFTFRLSKQKTLGIQMLLVIQQLKKYLTEHEPETLSTCHDKHLVSCQDAQRPLSKTASLPEGKCILLLYRILLSTVQLSRTGNSDIPYCIIFIFADPFPVGLAVRDYLLCSTFVHAHNNQLRSR